MNREEMVEKAAAADWAYEMGPNREWPPTYDPYSQAKGYRAHARAILDAVLPQVTTVAELEVLVPGVVAVDRWGAPWELEDGGRWRTTGIDRLVPPEHVLNGDGGIQLTGPRGPLTVVWQPS